MDTHRHGKWLLARSDAGSWLGLHFGMSGSLACFKEMADDPEHDRVLFSFDGGMHLAYDCHHRSDGAECPDCAGEVKRMKVNGRSTYLCPACQ